MKKFLALAITTVMMFTVLTGCGGTDTPDAADTTETTTEVVVDVEDDVETTTAAEDEIVDVEDSVETTTAAVAE